MNNPAIHSLAIQSLGAVESDELLRLAAEHSTLPWKNVLGGEHDMNLAKFYTEQWKNNNANVLFAEQTDKAHLAALVYYDLPWDSELLGMDCVRMFPLSSLDKLSSEWWHEDKDIISDVMDELCSRGVMLVDVKVSSSDLWMMRMFESEGFHTVDVLVTLGAKREKLQTILKTSSTASKPFDAGRYDNGRTTFQNGVIIRPIRKEEVQAMEGLAATAFSDTAAIKDRFYLEPSIPHERANRLFLEWFRNCVRKQEQSAGVVLVAEKDGTALGFLTLDSPTHPALCGYWQDGLNAMDEHARGLGIYRLLVIAAMHYVVEHEGGGLITRTQISTQRVINSWLHLGADLLESFCTLHWTPGL